MKQKLFSFFIMALLLVSVSVANAATTLVEIGRSPFHQPPLKTKEDLLSMLKAKNPEVAKGFALAGRSDLYEPFMDQVTKAKIDLVQFPKGSQFEWMFYKKKGKGTIRIVKDVTWGNDKPFPGFQFSVEKAGVRYTFVIPLGCGNVALMGESKIPEVVAATPPPNKPPQCGMTVTPAKTFCGENVTVDARTSTDPDGEITKMTIAFVDESGKAVSQKVVEGKTLMSEVAVPCGTNTLKVTVADNKGLEASSPACAVQVTGTSRVRFLADLGYYRQFDPANYVFGRVGMEYKFTEQFALLGLIGGAPELDGDGASAFLADLLAEFSFSRFFVDLGLGAWITNGDSDIPEENSQLDMIAGFGARVFGEPDKFNASVFVEARSAFDEMDEMYKYGRFGVGVRFRF